MLISIVQWHESAIFMYVPASLVALLVKKSTCNARDPRVIPVLGRSPGEGHANPVQYSCLENSHGQRRLAGYSPWGLKELDTTEWLICIEYHSTGQKRNQSSPHPLCSTHVKPCRTGAREFTQGNQYSLKCMKKVRGKTKAPQRALLTCEKGNFSH